MEQVKGSLGSQKQTQQLQHPQQQQNQSKKKSKNKKKNSKHDTNTVVARSSSDERQQQLHQPIDEGVVENGLTDQLKQQLHTGNNDNNTSLNNSNSSSCSSSNNSFNSYKNKNKNKNNNNNKVNGLMTEHFKNSKACPPATNITNVKELQPALNGHHSENEESSITITNGDVSPTNKSITMADKKSKKKPNNKKNGNSVDDNLSELNNGHCTGTVTTNGFDHKVSQSPSDEENKSKTAMTTTTTMPNNNRNVISDDSSIEKKSKEEKSQEQLTSAIESVKLSKNITPEPELDLSNVHIEYKEYESELQMHDIMRLIQAELSEPYSIYTYRYFIYNWPKLCFLAAHGNEYVGAIVCKLDMHMNVRRGYIAMLAVRKEYRKLRIGTTLVQKAIEAMLADKADEVVLETEMSNLPALRLYENLGFVRDKRLFRYYLNGVDALRLKLWFR